MSGAFKNILKKRGKDAEREKKRRKIMMKITDCKQKLTTFTMTPSPHGKPLPCPYTEKPSRKSIRKTKESSKVFTISEKRSSWSFSSQAEKNAPLPRNLFPPLSSLPSPLQIPYKSDCLGNIPSVSFIPIIRRNPPIPLLTAMQKAWRWNTCCMERKATMKTCPHRSPLF